MDAEFGRQRRGEADFLADMRFWLSLLPANLSHTLRRSGLAQHRSPNADWRGIAPDQCPGTRSTKYRACRAAHKRGNRDRGQVAGASAWAAVYGRAPASSAA